MTIVVVKVREGGEEEGIWRESKGGGGDEVKMMDTVATLDTRQGGEEEEE